MCADWHCLLGGIAPDPVSMSITSFYFVPPALSLIAHPCDVPETEKKGNHAVSEAGRAAKI